MKKFYISLLIFSIIFSSKINSQSTEIGSPDRPGQIESPEITETNCIHIDALFFYERFEYDNNIKLNNTSIPQMLIRYGIGWNVELRAEIDYTRVIVKSEKMSDYHIGFKPLSAGMKIKISEEGNLIPSVSTIMKIDLPNTGNKLYCSDNTNPGLMLLLCKSFNKFEYGFNMGINFCEEERTVNNEFALSVSTTPHKNLSIFLETYGYIYQSGSPDIRVDYGLGYSLSKYLQVSLSSGFGCTKKSPNFSFNLGFSMDIKR